MKLTGDLETLFLRQLFRSFGINANEEAFQQLARSVHKTIIHRQRNNLADLEAILFGQAGLLPPVPVDGYSAELMYRYINFRYKYSLVAMSVDAWKFDDGSDFPTVRIAQLAALLHQEEKLYARCMAPQTRPADLKAMLNVSVSDYWNDHLRFGIYSEKQLHPIGKEVRISILRETIIPVRELFKLYSDTET